MFTLRFTLTFALFFAAVQVTFAAPNIVSQNLTGAGTFTPGSTITFWADTRNVGTDMDTTNSYRLRVVENLTEVGGVYDYVVKGNYLYTFGYITSRQLHIYDISNPENATLVNTYTVPNAYTNSYVYELEIVGDLLILGGNNVADYHEMAILNISNPTNPTFVSHIDVTAWNSVPTKTCGLNDVEGMKVIGNKIYAAGGTGNSQNFCIFDISNPTSPSLDSSYQNLGFTGPIDVQGNYAYVLVTPSVVGGFQGIRVLDISNPANITMASEISTTGVGAASATHNVRAAGNYLYVGGGGPNDLKIFNISNPTAPTFAGQVDYTTINSNWISGVGVSFNYPYAYVSNQSGYVGVNVIDVSDPNNPLMKGHANGSASGVTGFNSRYVFSSGYAAPSLSVFKPFLRSRFCIDNPTCATGGSSLKTVDIDLLTANAFVSTSTTWVATAGTHTITYCSDIFDQYSFDGVAETDENDNCSSYTFTVSQPTMNIIVDAIECDSEADFPNWMSTKASIVDTDAANFVAANPNCRYSSGWSFEWKEEGVTSGAGVNAGVVGPPWNTFGPTNASGRTQVGLTAVNLNGKSRFDLRAAQRSGYFPFNDYYSTNSISAEFACHDDVNYYDNFEWVSNPVIGSNHYCVLITTSNVLPNFNRPIATHVLSSGFSSTTGEYNYVDISFQTTNDGLAGTGATASYNLQFDSRAALTGSIPLLAQGATSPNFTHRINNVPFGNHTATIVVDSGSSVQESNESDNVYVYNFGGVIPPPNPNINITADKIQLRNGETTVIRWSVVNSYPTLSCSVSGPGILLNPSPFSGNEPTLPISAKSEYVFSCIESITGTTWSDSVIVETQGTIEEI